MNDVALFELDGVGFKGEHRGIFERCPCYLPFLPQSWKGKPTPNERNLFLEGNIVHFP